MPSKNAAWLLAVALAGGCQCERIPEKACFEGEACARGGGSGNAGGAEAGGAEAGGVGGSSGGAQAGGSGGGSGGASGGSAFFAANDICETYECVLERWGSLSDMPPPFSLREVTVPTAPTQAWGNPGWRGGVLLPDGRILAPPAYSAQFLLIDPMNMQVELLPYDAGLDAFPMFSGAVLGCDGRVYVAPAGTFQVLRVELLADGGFDFLRLSGMVTGTGGIVVSRCEGDATHLIMPKPGGWFEATVWPDGGLVSSPASFLNPAFQPGATPQGVARFGATDIAFAPLPTVPNFTPAIPFTSPRVIPLAGQLDGGTLPRGIATIANGGVVTFADSKYFIASSSLLTWPVMNASAWPLARADGFVYAASTHLVAHKERDPMPEWDLGTWADGGEELGGLVNALNGMIVGIPGAEPTVHFFIPLDGGAVASKGLLLSPFLNKP